MFSFRRKKKKLSNLQLAIDQYVELAEKDEGKTYVLVEFVKKDKSIIFMVEQLGSLTVQIDGTHYYVDKGRLDVFKYKELTKKKGWKTHKIPRALLYEGVTIAFSPYEDINDPGFTERFQKAMYLEIKTGIMEAKQRMNMNLRKLITFGLIGLVALYLLSQWWTGG